MFLFIHWLFLLVGFMVFQVGWIIEMIRYCTPYHIAFLQVDKFVKQFVNGKIYWFDMCTSIHY